jgi:hypothetical protein
LKIKGEKMKNIKLWVGILVILILFGLILTGCPQEPSEKTYTVWTFTESYSEYSGTFGTLNDGYYRRIEIFSGIINV